MICFILKISYFIHLLCSEYLHLLNISIYMFLDFYVVLILFKGLKWSSHKGNIFPSLLPFNSVMFCLCLFHIPFLAKDIPYFYCHLFVYL